MAEDLAHWLRAGGREPFRAGDTADTAPVPRGEFRNGELIDGSDNGDGDDASVEPARLGSVVLPDEMKNDRVIRRIEMVPVISPAACAQVDLDAAGAKLASVEEDQRIAKIRPETVTPGAAVDDRVFSLSDSAPESDANWLRTDIRSSARADASRFGSAVMINR